MPLIPDGFGQLNMLFTGIGVPTGAQATIGFENVANDTPEDIATAVATLFGGWFDDNVFSANVEFSGVLCKLGPSDTGPSALVAASVVGGNAGAATAPNTAYLIHKNTAFGGRAGRGRMYLPGVVEPNVNAGGELLPATIATLDGGGATFGGAMGLAGYPLMLLHDAGSPLTLPSAVTSLSADSRAATQRRRMRR